MNNVDRTLAGWYFDDYIAPVVVTPEVPAEGAALMRRQYIEGAISNPDAMDEIRDVFQTTKDEHVDLEEEL